MVEGAEIQTDETEVTKYADGKAVTINSKGEVTDERDLPSRYPEFDDLQASEGDGETSETAPAEQPGEAPAGADETSQAEGDAAPSLEERYAKLEEENQRLRQINSGAHQSVEVPRVDPPKVEDLPAVDLSDMPDVFDRDKFDSNEEAQAALKEYFEAKQKEAREAHAKEYQKHIDTVSQQQAEAQAAQQYRRNELRAAEVVNEIRAKAATLSDEDFQSRFASVASLQHPEWKGGTNPPNTVHVNLVRGREAFMDQRAAMGLTVHDHDTVADIIAEQVMDPDFAQQVSSLVPDTVEGGNVLLSITQTEHPVSVLRYFTTRQGAEQVAELSKDRGAARMTPQQRMVLLNEIRSDVNRIHDELQEEPYVESNQQQQPGQVRQPAPPRAGQPSRAAGFQVNQQRSSRPARRGPKIIDPFTDAGSDAIVREAQKNGNGWRVV